MAVSTTDPWLVIGVAAITATAVLIAAIIAAISAGRRQKRELGHAVERQKRDLDESADRQKRELSHDRELAALDDRRAVLDEAAQLLLGMSRDVEKFRPSMDEIGYEFPTDLDKAMAETRNVEARLIIRLGIDHVATEAFREVVRVVNDTRSLVESANRFVEEHGSREFRQQVEEREIEMRRVLSSFLVSAKDAAS